MADAHAKEAARRVEIELGLANHLKSMDKKTVQVQQRLVAVALENMQADEIDPPPSRAILA